jgi:hypothetical protein
MIYRREEVGRRMSYIFACSAASGAFGGLIAYGLIRIRSGSLVGWQYLYIVRQRILIVSTALTCLGRGCPLFGCGTARLLLDSQ